MHTRQSSAKADDCGYARPFAASKKKKNRPKNRIKIIAYEIFKKLYLDFRFHFADDAKCSIRKEET